MNNDRRVVITGLGSVTPLGNDVETFWSNLKNGVIGIRAIDAFDTSAHDCRIGGQVHNFDPKPFLKNPKDVRRTDRSTQLAMPAAKMAIEDSETDSDDLERPDRTGRIVSTERPERASRPFDRERDGFVMSEGAGVVVVEELEHAKARGAKIYCEITGYGLSADAYHMTAPPPDGEGAARAMQLALEHARVSPDQVDYINAHATSTDIGDICETRAIKQVFGDYAYKVPISSTKSMTGHLLGGAGGVEMAACALAIRDSVIPPTINLENPGEECDLDYTPNIAREKKVRVALNNSFGFGGHNATLVAAAFEG